MLEHLPTWLGRALGDFRAGGEKLAIARLGLAGDVGAMTLSSPAFADGAPLPQRYTADGAGVSPPLAWADVPGAAATLALIVEDPDAPAPNPFVHAIALGIPASEQGLVEGALDGDTAPGFLLGRNSYRKRAWLPADPPSGHGRHRYVFQLFALDAMPVIEESPGRDAFLDAIRGSIVGAAMLVGVYQRP